MLLLLGIVLFVQTDEGTLRIEINDPEISVAVNGKEITITDATTSVPMVAVHEIRHCCVSLLRRGSEVAAIDGLAVQRRGRMRTDIIFRKYREAERGPTGHSNVRPAILQ